jgi:hypothetical protein
MTCLPEKGSMFPLYNLIHNPLAAVEPVRSSIYIQHSGPDNNIRVFPVQARCHGQRSSRTSCLVLGAALW